MSQFLTPDFLKFFIPLAGAVAGWLLNERRKRQSEEYLRKEERYRSLLLSLRGFYVGHEDVELKQEFLNQLALAWLYCSDDVIRKGNAFAATVKVGSSTDDEARNTALAALVGAIRRDLISRTVVRKTDLSGAEFEKFTVTRTPA